tara:strand:- start:1364 stop:1702 length:339 start_codon:yes stop_codon:yes gene_type:complete
MNTIDPKFLARKLANEKKLKPQRRKYNLRDPMQRKQAWIRSVCYFAYLEKGRDVANALRIELTKPYVQPSIKKIANEIWSRKKEFDNIIERKVNEYSQAKESYRQKSRDRRK